MRLHAIAATLLLGLTQAASLAADTTSPEPEMPAAADPQHPGALECSRELALMTGELPVAEARLAALDKACNGRCEELDDLKKAIARYKANGNRWLP